MCDGIDCENNLTYSGSYSSSGLASTTGVVLDGGMIGFNGFGYLYGMEGLSVFRQADVLQDINTYRWVDTFTNTGNADISNRVIEFWGNLGSDSGGLFDTEVGRTNDYSSVSWENMTDTGDPWTDAGTGDPVFGMVWGNNDWSLDNMFFSRADPTGHNAHDLVISRFLLDLDVGQSISIAHFATLMRPDADYYVGDNGAMYYQGDWTYYDYDPTATIAAVENWADGMIANPYFVGLNDATIASIANFGDGGVIGGNERVTNVPEPAMLGLLCAGLLGLSWSRTQRA